ncbi:MAG TPA: hypothetical protein VJ718_10785 [Candidatus Binataceae bacterium]|nr:hypothetical protein [Candidatus Binataceae bacterium]
MKMATNGRLTRGNFGAGAGDGRAWRTVSRQLTLTGLGIEPGDLFRFTWWNTPEGATVWIEYRGSMRPGVVVHRGRKYVSVMLTDAAGRTRYMRREYGALRRRAVKPKLIIIAKA